ncbi:hypothetical protein SKAU_G00225100 [Synaphobranchus kaupii]|uniref:Cell division cycle associated 3 n=1 Tax=Synaphobranchus kaupii TaxID=118154 RepID=A0A9Q1FC36_SYNKA|nr:hypothetical protein SKAU_G00225100 [Synaphobranchus kaupii]
MGASESKIAVETPKPERCRQIRNEHISRLVDPRSPSTGIDRTPIQVGEAASRGSVEVECEGPVLTGDPRSPSPAISRTPMKDVMRATVNSFARRLGMLFLNEGGDRAAPLPPLKFSEVQSLNLEEDGELDSAEPLLPLHPSLDSDPLSPSIHNLPTPTRPADQTCDSEALSTQSSGCQAAGDERQVGQEVDQILESEEATADGDPPLNKELSLSLLTCHDGVPSSLMVSDDTSRPLSPLSDADPCKVLDSEACPSPTPDSVQSLSAEASTSTSSDIAEPPNDKTDAPAKPESIVEESPKPAAADPSPTRDQSPQAQSGLDQIGVKRPTFNTKSPSQVVFKPQWLGVGFGVAGVRARGVQGKGKGSSSPLSVRVGGRNVGNENRGQVVKQKQRERCGKALASDGRSPLQILKETNSPMEHASQMKLKISTPDRQRLGQVDRRALSLHLNKENQR